MIDILSTVLSILGPLSLIGFMLFVAISQR